MATKAKTETIDSEILEVHRERRVMHILGRTPYIANRVSVKAGRQLLLPSGRKNAAEKATSLKHDPVFEFRASPYRLTDPDSPTALGIPSTSFKKAMSDAALDIPGSAKSQIGRLSFVEGDYVAVYGLPRLKMDIVRSADINRTPDVRTRACLPQWACEIVVSFAVPLISGNTVQRLMAAAGVIRGVGDWRPQKGSGDYGQFECVGQDDPRWAAIVSSGGREAQLEALANPVCYDAETEEMLEWFKEEVERREMTKHLNSTDDFDDDDEDAPSTNGHLELVRV